MSDRPDKSYVPSKDDRVSLTECYTRISNRWVDWAPHELVEFRVLMIIGRQTVGRKKTWNKIANRYFEERIGWHGLTPTKGTDTQRVIDALRWAESFKMAESRFEIAGTMKQWRLSPTRDRIFTIERREPKTKREMWRLEQRLDEREDDDDVADLYLRDNFMQWPNVFEDVMAPNIPRHLSRFLMRVWTETHGRLNHKRDGYGAIRPWKAALDEVGGEMRWTNRQTVWDYLNFAEEWKFVTVNRSAGKTNTYLPGPHMWRLAQTGDLSPSYREALAEFGITPKPGKPALVLRPTRRRQKVA